MSQETTFYKTAHGVRNGSNPLKYARKLRGETNGDRKTDYPMTLSVMKQVVGASVVETRTWNSYWGKWDEDVTIGHAFAPLNYHSITETSQSDVSIEFGHEATQVAIGRLLSNLKSNNWNASLFIAESAESFKMIADASTRLYAAMRALKRGRLGDVYKALGISSVQRGRYGKRRYPPAKQIRENMANYWLEVKLGWMPLLQDIHDGADKIAKMLYAPAPLPLMEVIGTGAVHPSDVSVVENDESVYQTPTTIRSRRVTSARVVVRYHATHQMIATAQSLGLTNPMSLLYEATPLSFVLDYVIPIGDWLESLTAYQGLDFHSGCVTVKYHKDVFTARSSKGAVVTNYGIVRGVLRPTGYHRKSGESSTTQLYGQYRTPLTAFPRPNAPSFGYSLATNNRDVQRAGTILALIKQFRF